MRWTNPRIVEIKMDAEIGSYQEDGDDRGAPLPAATATSQHGGAASHGDIGLPVAIVVTARPAGRCPPLQ
jgi:hypothetical protein